MLGLATLGTGIEAPTGEDTTSSRKCRIDRENVGSATAFADHLRVVWLTPAMDPLFNGPAAERRRFLDRLVLAVDAQHSARVNALERSLRSRNRLLEDPRSDPHWLDAIERETAEVAVAVAAARAETVGRLAGALHAARDAVCPPSPCRRSRSTAGWRRCCRTTARSKSKTATANCSSKTAPRTPPPAARSTDRIAPISRSAMPAKGIPAADCSTGEQKALLIRLVLAHSSLIKDMTGYAPLMLLDEVVAHLDPMRRAALYDALAALGAQVWMTGADPAAFGDIVDRAQVFEVRGGTVEPRL